MSATSVSRGNVILKYYLYRATGNPGFILPIYILYAIANGVTYTQIGVIGTVQAVIVVGGEIPTGYIGDRIGRRNSLWVGELLFATSNATLVFAEGFVWFLAAFSLMSVANTFVSGSAEAWLYDTLNERLEEDTYTQVNGRGNAVGQWAKAVTMIAGSLLYVLDPTYPFYAALAMNFVNVVVTLTMPKTEQYATDGESDDEESFTIVDVLPIIRRRLTKSDIRWFVLFMALFFGVSGSAKTYIQPITVNSLKTILGSVFTSLGIPEAALLGLLYASFTVVSGIASDQASKLEEVLGIRRVLLVVPFSMAFLFVVPVVFPIMVFPMFFGMRIAKSLLRPISGQYLNDHIESVGRATILSAVSMVYALLRVPFTLGSGLVADYTSPRVAVAAMGALFVVAGVTLYAWRSPVRGDRETKSREMVRAE